MSLGLRKLENLSCWTTPIKKMWEIFHFLNKQWKRTVAKLMQNYKTKENKGQNKIPTNCYVKHSLSEKVQKDIPTNFKILNLILQNNLKEIKRSIEDIKIT